MSSSETTPLLSSSLTGHSSQHLPDLHVFIDQIIHDNSDISHIVEEVTSSFTPNARLVKPYLLLVLLSAATQLQASGQPDGVVEGWLTSDARAQKRLLIVESVEATWQDILSSVSSDQEFSNLLWQEFSVDSTRTCRIIDLLAHSSAADSLLAHPLVELHVSAMWRYGKPRTNSSSISGILFSRFDGLATPRSVHTVDLMLLFLYLGLLLNYLLDPPEYPTIIQGYLQDFGVRGIFLGTYSAAYLIKHRTLRGVPHGLVLLSLILAIPDVPIPGDGAFEFLTFAFVLHILLLHLPIAPSPLLLSRFQPDNLLPLVVLLSQSVSQSWIPALMFFLPVMFFAANLLSISLADVYVLVNLSGPTANHLPEAPIQTRFAFLALYLIVITLFLSSATVLILVFASTTLSSSQPSNQWDRYGQPIGLEARRKFLRILIAYSPSNAIGHATPTPLNLIPFFLIEIPSQAVRIARPRGVSVQMKKFSQDATLLVWRLTVVPFAAMITAAHAAIRSVSTSSSHR